MQDFVRSLARDLAQKLVGVAAVWLVAHGIDVPAAVSDWAVLAIVTAGLFVWTAAVRFLETRNSPAAHLLARVLMLGIVAKPTYPPQTPAVVAEMRARQAQP